MTYKENVKAMQKQIDKHTRRGEWWLSSEAYNRLAEFKSEHWHERSKMLLLEIGLYCKENDIDFREFCLNFGFDEYYLQKVIIGLIRPSNYFTQSVICRLKGERNGVDKTDVWKKV